MLKPIGCNVFSFSLWCHPVTMFCYCKILDWCIKKGGISQSGSTSYLLQRVKLPMSTKFNVSITIYSKLIHNTVLEALESVPKSKNRRGGHFSAWVYILSFSACQTTYVHQVSCFYHNLQQAYSQYRFRGLGGQYPSLKIEQGGIFQRGSTSYLFNRVELPMLTMFHAGFTWSIILCYSSPH